MKTPDKHSLKFDVQGLPQQGWVVLTSCILPVILMEITSYLCASPKCNILVYPEGQYETNSLEKIVNEISFQYSKLRKTSETRSVSHFQSQEITK